MELNLENLQIQEYIQARLKELGPDALHYVDRLESDLRQALVCIQEKKSQISRDVNQCVPVASPDDMEYNEEPLSSADITDVDSGSHEINDDMTATADENKLEITNYVSVDTIFIGWGM